MRTQKRTHELPFRPIRVKDPMYGEHILLCVHPERSEVQRWVKRRFGIEIEINPFFTGYFTTLENPQTGLVIRLVWLPRFEWYNEQIATLAHELFHLVMWVLDDRGIGYTPENHEPFAYYLGAMMRAFCEVLAPWNPSQAHKRKLVKGARKKGEKR